MWQVLWLFHLVSHTLMVIEFSFTAGSYNCIERFYFNNVTTLVSDWMSPVYLDGPPTLNLVKVIVSPYSNTLATLSRSGHYKY